MKLSCIFGHKWNGCTCERCGEVRNEGHEYTKFTPHNKECIGYCKCGRSFVFQHDYQTVPGKCYDVCSRCGSVRELEHQWQSAEGTDKEKCAVCGMVRPVQTAKPWTPPIPAAKTELGERLKQRFIEFDIHGSAEQLTPYFDEALAAARDADDPHTFYWACRTLHELLRLPENDAFRKRAGEISALERVRQRVSLLQLDAVRYNQPDPKLNEIVAANLKALNGRDMVEALEDARRFNTAWIEVAGKAGKYPGSMKEAERDTFEKEVCAICARLNCCSALDQLVNFIVKIMQAVQQTEQMGGGVFTMSVNLQTGARETSRNPTLSEAEDFGVRMVASLPREALMRCLENDDFSIDPTADRHNYDLFLRRAASRVGLIA